MHPVVRMMFGSVMGMIAFGLAFGGALGGRDALGDHTAVGVRTQTCCAAQESPPAPLRTQICCAAPIQPANCTEHQTDNTPDSAADPVPHLPRLLLARKSYGLYVYCGLWMQPRSTLLELVLFDRSLLSELAANILGTTQLSDLSATLLGDASADESESAALPTWLMRTAFLFCIVISPLHFVIGLNVAGENPWWRDDPCLLLLVFIVGFEHICADLNWLCGLIQRRDPAAMARDALQRNRPRLLPLPGVQLAYLIFSQGFFHVFFFFPVHMVAGWRAIARLFPARLPAPDAENIADMIADGLQLIQRGMAMLGWIVGIDIRVAPVPAAPKHWPAALVLPGSLDSLDVPPGFVCPITHSIMTTPACTPTGESFEFSALAEWVSKSGSHPTNPSKPLSLDQLCPNLFLRSEIEQFVQDHVQAAVRP
ncbi:hypothetical protein EMIHUDRAFT_218819 [Emiliania huxleyi CCMP1516]|uniref:U-box domain-containing protein n=2 Tax=Emiliania huxleyi TaxID=2903 RepID=A0A0D3I676_EMIH1|nr:hypothetical protein EMIHUDRAFT_218819 [Emiliania huxleyi CCMP1516]EOD06761.1 hypothetical protein EMIHUDRAFT_218819 [Emiliania huxleyi CCMP1516]|eukprot:XP_005759190.1 hypothetical protein EMIHUDRAFT_218819 [Emiliania huxleyi CCMP1516]